MNFRDLLLACEQCAPAFAPSDCAYFPDEGASARVSAFILSDLGWSLPALTADDADFMLNRGWRHFGDFFFRNSCPDCGRCRSLRVPAAAVLLSPSQRRVRARGRELVSRFFAPDEFAALHFDAALALHNEFLAVRFDKAPQTAAMFREEFFASPLPGFVHALFAPDGRLAGCGWLDRGRETLSSVYFSFAPEFSRFSPGTLSLLREIEWAATHGIRHYHVGYWIENHPAMRYKAALLPHELYDMDADAWRASTTSRPSVTALTSNP